MRVLKMSRWSVAIFVLFAGCVEALAKPITLTLRVTGRDSNAEKREVCQKIAFKLGATVVENAPIVAVVNLDSSNTLTVTRNARTVIDNIAISGIGTDTICDRALRAVAAMPPVPQVSLQSFVGDRISSDEAFKKLVTAAEAAFEAYTLQATTNTEDFEEGSDASNDLIALVNAAQNARKTYEFAGWTLAPSVFDTNGTEFMPDPEGGKVPLPGGPQIRLRVSAANPMRVALVAIEGANGRQIVTFDSELGRSIAPEFRPYLVGDRVDVRGTLHQRIKRGKQPDAAPIAPYAPPSVGGGCAKDNDCKGDRVCERGECVNPRR